MHHRLPAAFLCSLLGAVLAALAATGYAATVTVTVSSADSAQLLQQARVELAPSGREAMTDNLGTAVFLDVAPGDYTARITYLGFADQSVTVRVTDRPRVDVSVPLKTEAAVQLDAFVVTSEREGNAAALTRQKNAASVRNVIAMDALGVLANDNPAELLNRLPGIYSLPSDEGNLDRPTIRGLPATMNVTTIDGGTVVSQLAMSRSPIYTNMTATNFEEIEVTKSLTPNLPADSISGRVNFKTKSTLNLKGKRELTFRFGGKWSPTFFELTPRRTTPQVQPNLSVSYREAFGIFGEARNLGLSANFVYNDNITQRMRTLSTLDTVERLPRFTHSYSRTDGVQDRILYTGNVRTDFRLGPDSRLFFSAMRSFQEQATKRPQNYQVAYNANVATAGRSFATGVNADGTPSGGGNIRPGSTVLRTEVLRSTRTSFQAATNPFEADDMTDYQQFGGEHRFGPWRLDYTLSNSRSERNTGAYRQHSVRRNWTASVTNVGWILDKTASEEFPTFTQTSGPSILDPRNYASGSVSQTSAVSVNRATSAELNLKREVEVVGQRILLATGSLATSQSSVQDSGSRTSTYVGPDGVAGVNPVTRVNDDDLSRFASFPPLMPRLGLGPVPTFDPGKYSYSLDHEPAQWRVDPYQVESARRAGQSAVRERILAAYAMGTARVGRLGVVTGVRWEESRTRSSGFLKRATLPAITDPVARTDAEYGKEPVVRRGRTSDFFPSLHFRYAFTPNLVGRASWSTSIGRQALGDLVPAFSASDLEQTVTLDNPSLKPQFADSYDLSLEYYLKPVGQLMVTLFRKDLTDFVFRQEMGVVAAGPDNGFGGQYAGYDIISNGNGGRGRVDGIEFSYLQQLTFLPGALRGLSVLLNYTHLSATGDYGQGSGGTTGLVGFVPDTANARIGYKYQWFAPYVQWTYTGRSLGNFATDPQLQSHRLERRIVNVGFSVRLPRNLEFFFDAANLFDEPQRTTHYVSGNRMSTYYNGPFVSFGISGRY
ncbi:MAG: TonB-dependent receptor [Verrucomicrobia bacterium]|nr:TonB-dependent receptor [Verrucomicrobiota bacterium]